MPSTYSPNLKVQLMQTGEKTGQWGAITNVNLGNVIEQALTYQSVVTMADSPTPTDLVSVQGTSVGDTARSLFIKLTGALTATRTLRTIAAPHFYIVQNATTGGQSINFISQAVGSVGVVIPNGGTAVVYCDGTNVIATTSFVPALSNTTITDSTINSTPIGNVTPSSAVFTSGSAQTFNVTVGGTMNGITFTNASGSYSSITVSSLTCTGGSINGTTIGATTPSTGVFTTLVSSAGTLNGSIGSVTPNTGLFTNLFSSGVYVNTVVDGSSPMTITSTTRVANLNVARAGYADQIPVANTTTNATFYPAFFSAVTGNLPVYVSSTKWSFNPSTGAMSLSGAFTPTSLTPTNPLGIAYGGTGTTRGFADPRTVVVASGTSITPDADTSDIVVQINTGTAGTVTINAPTGTPVNGQKLTFRITTTNSQTLAYNAIYGASTDLALPTAMISGTTNYLGFAYNSTASKWQLLAKVFGF